MITILIIVLICAYIFLKVSNTRAKFAEADAKREAEEEAARQAAEKEAEEAVLRAEAIDVDPEVIDEE